MLILKYRIWTFIHCITANSDWNDICPPPDYTELRHCLGCIYSNRCRISTSPLSGLCDFSFFHLQFSAQLCSVSRCWRFHGDKWIPRWLRAKAEIISGWPKAAVRWFHHFSHSKHFSEALHSLNISFVLDVSPRILSNFNISLKIFFVYSPALIIQHEHNAEFGWFILLCVLNAPDLSDATLQEELFACLFLLHAQP